MNFSYIPRWFYHEKKYAAQTKVWGWIYLFFASFSLLTGAVYFFMTMRWFPLGDMLRSLLIDVLFTIPIVVLPSPFAIGLLLIWFFLFFISTVINIAHILIYQAPISMFAIQSIFETTSNEAKEFIIEFFSVFNVIIFLLVFAIAFFLLLKSIKERKKEQKFSLQWIVLFLIICVPLIHTSIRKGNRLLLSQSVYQFYSTLFHYSNEIHSLENIRSKRDSLSISSVKFLDGDPFMPRTYVFIIGESANRNHLSLYGYNRKTTPLLESIRQELFIFEDVISPDTHTIPSLRKVLLFSSPHKGTPTLSSPSFLTLLKSAGFKTYWLSNQAVNVDGATGVRVFAEDSSKSFFLNMARDEGRSVSYDAVVIPELEKILHNETQRKAIFIHLMGSYLTYGLRYPPEFARFSSTKDIPTLPWRGDKEKHYVNTYDNSICYTDFIVFNIIDLVKKQGGYSFVLYFSDHGQEVYDTRHVRGQIASDPSKHMLDIPFLIWFSQEYQDMNPSFMKRVKKAVRIPWVTSGFTHAATELVRLSFEGFEPEKSLFSEQYRSWVRYAPNGSRYDVLEK